MVHVLRYLLASLVNYVSFSPIIGYYPFQLIFNRCFMLFYFFFFKYCFLLKVIILIILLRARLSTTRIDTDRKLEDYRFMKDYYLKLNDCRNRGEYFAKLWYFYLARLDIYRPRDTHMCVRSRMVYSARKVLVIFLSSNANLQRFPGPPITSFIFVLYKCCRLPGQLPFRTRYFDGRIIYKKKKKKKDERKERK